MHHQVITDKVKMVAIEARGYRAIQSLSQLAIENEISQALALDEVIQGFRHAHAKTACRG
jgi:predicted Fe-Mo cluster-binding NifX family protein